MLHHENGLKKSVGITLIFISVIMLGYILQRGDFSLLIAFFTLGCSGVFILSQLTFNFKSLLLIGIALRIALIFSIPILSDDYFRFLWDGFLSNQGINPFEFKPTEITSVVFSFLELFERFRLFEIYFDIWGVFCIIN